MISRRVFIGTVAGGLLAAPLAAEAQQPGKTARVGSLRFGPSTGQQQTVPSPFEAALKERGWVEGQNLVMERRYGESAEQLHAAAAELVLLKVDVLVVPSCGLAKIARGETTVIPIVIQACGYDLAEAGLVASLARPCGLVFGST